MFKLRKLCSSAEEYEANAIGPLDLDQFTLYLSRLPGVETSRYGPILTALFEDEGVVVRLYKNGKASFQAGLREDAEHVCSILSEIYESINQSAKD